MFPTLSSDGHALAYTIAQRLYVRTINAPESRTTCLMKSDERLSTDISFSWSPDGALLAYSVDASGQNSSAGSAFRSTRIWNRATDQTTDLGPQSDSPLWSPDSSQLAFQTHSTPNAEPKHALWSRNLSSTKLLTGITGTVSWAGDSRHLVITNRALLKSTQLDEHDTVGDSGFAFEAGPTSKPLIWESDASKKDRGVFRPSQRDDFRNSGYDQEERRTLFTPMRSTAQAVTPQRFARHIAILDLETDSLVSALTTPDDAIFRVSPDGKQIIAFGDHRSSNSGGANLWDVYLANISTGDERRPRGKKSVYGGDNEPWTDGLGERLTPIITALRQSHENPDPVWSPNSKRVVFKTAFDWGHRGDGDVWVIDVAPRRLRNLTSAVSFAKSRYVRDDMQNSDPTLANRRFWNQSPIVWAEDSQSILTLGEGDLWCIDALRGGGKNLTSQFTAGAKWVHPIGYRGGIAGNAVLVSISNPLTQGTTIAKLDLSGRLSKKGHAFSPGQDFVVTSDGVGYFTDSDWNRFPNYFAIGNSFDADPKCELLVDQQSLTSSLIFPKRKYLTWKTNSGRVAHGILILPSTNFKEQRPSLIMSAYPDVDVDVFLERDNRQLFNITDYKPITDRGYAYFVFDVPLGHFGTYRGPGPLKEIVGYVLSALDAVQDSGLIDEKHVGLIGHSYGGYMVNCVITQSNRFAAGISLAGISNLTSIELSHGTGTWWAEHGQGRMGSTIWDHPERYALNSPITFLPSVNTPLMLVASEDDSTVPIEQSEEMYFGLKRLGKPVVLIRFKDGGHGSHMTEWDRLLNYFDVYLKQPAGVAGK